MDVWHLLFLRSATAAAAAALVRSLGRDLSGLHSRRATPSTIRVRGENKRDVVVVGRRLFYNNAFRRDSKANTVVVRRASNFNNSRSRSRNSIIPRPRCRYEGVKVRECVFLVKVNARVRRVPKAVHVLVTVYYHDHTDTEHRSHREVPMEACDNCFSGVLWWAMVVVYAGGMWWWRWCMAGLLPATHTPS